jgi:hypothetical protein
MKSPKNVFRAILSVLIITTGCGKVAHKYMYDQNFSKDEFPRKIYIAEQVNPLNTEGFVPEKKQPFVEVTERDGDQKTGKLKEIREEEVVVITGYNVEDQTYSTMRKDVEEIIAKKDILLLKIW